MVSALVLTIFGRRLTRTPWGRHGFDEGVEAIGCVYVGQRRRKYLWKTKQPTITLSLSRPEKPRSRPHAELRQYFA